MTTTCFDVVSLIGSQVRRDIMVRETVAKLAAGLAEPFVDVIVQGEGFGEVRPSAAFRRFDPDIAADALIATYERAAAPAAKRPGLLGDKDLPGVIEPLLGVVAQWAVAPLPGEDG